MGERESIWSAVTLLNGLELFFGRIRVATWTTSAVPTTIAASFTRWIVRNAGTPALAFSTSDFSISSSNSDKEYSARIELPKDARTNTGSGASGTDDFPRRGGGKRRGLRLLPGGDVPHLTSAWWTRTVALPMLLVFLFDFVFLPVWDTQGLFADPFDASFEER
ncbi:hypothetical protein CH379_002355, partial [Leptospira ellisii]|nr:hypothetical protein [Leptospira ellisii]